MSSVAVLIPTVNRAEKLAPLVARFRAVATVPTGLYLATDHDDVATREAFKLLDGDDDVTTIVGDFHSVTKGTNAAWAAVRDEKFALTCNDDVWPEDGWDRAALDALGEKGKHVCGVNDGHDRMFSFCLVRCSYIRQHSGVYDEPNKLFHDGYLSQYPDTELHEYAVARGVWTEAPGAVIRHVHHDFGDADPNHPNYVKARGAAMGDFQTYRRRLPHWQAAART
jgi:hypothetical protein